MCPSTGETTGHVTATRTVWYAQPKTIQIQRKEAVMANDNPTIGARREPHPAYTFLVEINDDPDGSAYFKSVSGLKSEAEAVALQEGGLNDFERKLVGRTKNPNLVLKRGMTTDKGWKKRLKFMGSGAIERFSGAIVQLGSDGKPVARWQFKRAWVCKWEGPDFDAGKNEISIETMEIAHEGLSKA